jgi:GTP 3',8-cyclase
MIGNRSKVLFRRYNTCNNRISHYFSTVSQVDSIVDDEETDHIVASSSPVLMSLPHEKHQQQEQQEQQLIHHHQQHHHSNKKRPRLEALRQTLQNEVPHVTKSIFTQKQAIPSVNVVSNAKNNNNNTTNTVVTTTTTTSQSSTTTDTNHNNHLDRIRTMLLQIPDPADIPVVVQTDTTSNSTSNARTIIRNQTLYDQHDRFHNYLRISVSERCNLRCVYCMPEHGIPLQKNELLLSTSEIIYLATIFGLVGVNKFRITGGEPTLRKDLSDIIYGLHNIHITPNHHDNLISNDTTTTPISPSIGMTTNGIVLYQHLDQYHEAGLNSVNISLDTIHETKFEQLTRRPATYLSRVWKSLDHAIHIANNIDTNFIVKLNCVIMRGTNENEVIDFIKLTQQYNKLQVRFIEYMPFSDNGWNTTKFISYQELIQNINQHEDETVHLYPIPSNDVHDTTKWYQTKDGNRIGFITSMSNHFCNTCNRLRLTADGQIKVCLFDGGGGGDSSNNDSSIDSINMISLRDAIRYNFNDVEIRKLIYLAVQKKHAVLGGHTDMIHIQKDASNNRPMTLIGG